MASGRQLAGIKAIPACLATDPVLAVVSSTLISRGLAAVIPGMVGVEVLNLDDQYERVYTKGGPMLPSEIRQ